MCADTNTKALKGSAVRENEEQQENPATVDTKSNNGRSFSVTYKEELLESFNINREAASKIIFGTAIIQDTGDKSDDAPVISRENLMLTDNTNTEICMNSNESMASSGTDEVCGEELRVEPATNPFHYMARVPKFNVETLKEQIRLQQIELDDRTQQRDAVGHLIQESRKAINQRHGGNFRNAKNHAESAWNLVKSKRAEINILQPMYNKVKNAATTQDLDQRICNLEYRIKHESMPLKEEKLLILELKQQKQRRKELSLNIGSHAETKESHEQLEPLDKRMKSLWREHNTLRGNAEKADSVIDAVKAQWDGDVGHKKVEELQARYRVADCSQKESYHQLMSLKQELTDKNKNFYKYKNDETAAKNYARNMDRGALDSHCKNQVENFMELWNNNDKFRQEYVACNAKRTVQKFGTLDGRALGPNEKSPVVPDYVPSVDQKVQKFVSTPVQPDSVSKTLVLEQEQETKLENGNSDEKANKKPAKSKGKASVKDKEAAEPGLTVVSRKKVPVKVQVRLEPTKSREEIELERKAGELRREAEAKLKEKLQLEQDKAKEAREKKKRKEEQEKGRAILRARKETELKEKAKQEKHEREERLRKEKEKEALASVPAAKPCVIVTGIISAMMGMIVLWTTYLN